MKRAVKQKLSFKLIPEQCIFLYLEDSLLLNNTFLCFLGPLSFQSYSHSTGFCHFLIPKMLERVSRHSSRISFVHYTCINLVIVIITIQLVLVIINNYH